MDFVYSLAHYFYPRHSNNHKAKLVHSSTLFVLAICLVVYQVILSAIPVVGLKTLGYAANISADEVIRLTNEKRAQSGVSALSYNPYLAQAAQAKARHMLQYDYWAHIAPDGTEPWKFFTDVGYKYRYAGENLARDFSDPSSAVDAWMASSSHRDNLLSGKYTEIGVGVTEGDLAGADTTIIVQFFGTPLVDTTQQAPLAQAQVINSPTPIVKPTTVVATPSITQTITPEVTPTPYVAAPLISQVPPPAISETGRIDTLTPAESEAGFLKILFSPFESTRNISIAITAILLLVFFVDAIVIARRRIKRVGGRNFAHLAFLGMILAILLIAKAGEIL